MASAPAEGSTPNNLRTKKSPRPKEDLNSSIATPTYKEFCANIRSSSVRLSIRSRNTINGTCRSNSNMMLLSPLVI